jgi:hypothetical protein
MKRNVNFAAFLAATLLMAGCNFFSPQEDTGVQLLQVENQAYSTELAAIQATATTISDRLLVTLAFAQTAVRNVDMQSTRIASTMIAGGAAMVDAAGITPIAPTAMPQTNGQSLPAVPGSSNTFVTPIVIGEGSARGSISLDATPIITPIQQPTAAVAAESTQAVVASGEANLTNITVTNAVGADDCPMGARSEFDPAQDTTIYITAVGNNLTSANVVSSRWLVDGTEAVVYDWSPSGEVNGACIWFYITPEAIDFTPGNWSVELSVDGVIAGTGTFTITGDTMTEGG